MYLCFIVFVICCCAGGAKFFRPAGSRTLLAWLATPLPPRRVRQRAGRAHELRAVWNGMQCFSASDVPPNGSSSTVVFDYVKRNNLLALLFGKRTSRIRCASRGFADFDAEIVMPLLFSVENGSSVAQSLGRQLPVLVSY